MLLAKDLYPIFVNKKDSPTTLNSIKDGIFYNDATGWSMKIPDEWELLPEGGGEIHKQRRKKKIFIETKVAALKCRGSTSICDNEEYLSDGR